MYLSSENKDETLHGKTKTLYIRENNDAAQLRGYRSDSR